MKKMFLIVAVIIGGVVALAGFNVSAKSGYQTIQDDTTIKIVTDKDTCVMYGFWNYHGAIIQPLYNADGSLRVNKKCMNNK